MNIQQIAMMKQNYAVMSDDALIHILVTGEASLTDEAKLALHSVIKDRNISNLDDEVRATRDDIRAQAIQAQRQMEQQAKAANIQRKLLYGFFALMVLAGFMVAIFGNLEEGLLIAGAGGLLFAWTWLKRIIARFIAALFRND
jgi:hypothetical protein